MTAGKDVEPDEGRRVVVDVVMPARNEAATVAANVDAALRCGVVRRVIVVDDGSTDGTGEIAERAGATVVRRHADAGSKAHAMRAGVEVSDATHILFVDADCTDLTPAHLAAICQPVLDGRAEMSLGAFDYNWLNWLVLRLPPLSGERIVPRWVWDRIPDTKLDGYTIEIRLNEVIGNGRHRTSARTMVGVYHRTKRDKFGRIDGLLRTWRMFRDLVLMLRPIGDVRWRTYPRFVRNLTIEQPATPGGCS